MFLYVYLFVFFRYLDYGEEKWKSKVRQALETIRTYVACVAMTGILVVANLVDFSLIIIFILVFGVNGPEISKQLSYP